MKQRLITSNRAVFFVAALILCSFSASAVTLKGEGTVGSTSDGINYRYFSIGAITQPVDIFYPYRDEADDQFSWGASSTIHYRELYFLHTDSIFLLGSVTKKINSRLSLSANLGADRTAILGRDSKSGGNGSLNVSGYLFENNFTYSLTGEHGLAYSVLGVQDRFVPNLRSTSVALNLSYKLTPKIRAGFLGVNGVLSDGNIREMNSLELMYGIAPTDPWLWIGLYGSHQRFIWIRNDYWSPGKLYNVGSKLDFQMGIVGDWYVGAGGSVTAMKEDALEWGWASYHSLGLQWRTRNQTNARLYWNHIRSQRSGILWTQNEIVLQANIFF